MRSLFPHQFTLLFINSFALSVIRKNALSTNYTLEQRFQILMPVSKMKVESEKVGLKLNIQKTKIMASGPITSWEIDGETVETVSDCIFGGSKITAMVTAAMKLKDAYSLEEKL